MAGMKLSDVTYNGPPIDDAEILEFIPADLRGLLERQNGFVAFRGGLHVRGACREPAWHSLRRIWMGEEALAERYTALSGDDIPFAQDALGDQYLLRGGVVFRLASETGEVESMGKTLSAFLTAAGDDPIDYLALAPLVRFGREGGRLEPGQLLSVFPPFCVETGSLERSYRAVAAADRLRFLADLADQIAAAADGETVRFKGVE